MSTLVPAAVLAAVGAWLLAPAHTARLRRRQHPPFRIRILSRPRAPRAVHRAQLAELPAALDFLAACLEVGLPLSRAVRVVADISPAATAGVLAAVAARSAAGHATSEAWTGVRSHPVWGRVAADIAGAERWGTSAAGLLRAHAEDARQDGADAAMRRARTVGVRSALPLMVCFLPSFVLVGVVPIVAGLVTDLLG
ncbi:type II secretion system F family protein [Tessaracoccus lapidicaptus]|uniref:type II secretion system F family protein n=1 Tax=Tessaracoccus lapidicaptus TaxID=1427523 RepID=UPI00159EF6BC|nr:type II secretion system F family protein [Tessaracoccus lapidicaptus]